MSDPLADLYLLLQNSNGSSGSKKSSGNYLSWMWSEPGADSILSWIVNNVNSKCLLSLRELDSFNQLQTSGRITDSCLVTDAVPFSKTCDRSSTSHCQEKLQRDIETLSRQQKVSMDVLCKGRQRHVNLTLRLTNCKQSLELAQHHVNENQLLLNSALKDSVTVLSHTGEYLHDAENSVIQKQLDDYLEIDNAFLKNVKNAFESLRLKGREIDKIVLSPEESFEQNVKELERIKSIFVMSERQKIDADVFLSHVKAEEISIGTQTLDSSSIQRLCEDLKRQYSSLYRNKLLPLLNNLAKYQKTDVLRGDYKLKISRQQNSIRLQEKIFHELLHERSRHSLLECALKEAHTDQLKLLELVDALLTHIGGLQREKMEKVVSEIDYDCRKAIDDSDEKGLCVERALCACIGEHPSTILVTYNRIEQLAKTLANAISVQDSNITQANSDHCDILSKLVRGIAQMYALMTLSSSTCQPTLSHQPLLHLISQVQQVMEDLKEKITILQVKEASKRRAVSEDLDLNFERNIFINFFQNPSVLDDDVRKLCLKTNRK